MNTTTGEAQSMEITIIINDLIFCSEIIPCDNKNYSDFIKTQIGLYEKPLARKNKNNFKNIKVISKNIAKNELLDFTQNCANITELILVQRNIPCASKKIKEKRFYYNGLNSKGVNTAVIYKNYCLGFCFDNKEHSVEIVSKILNK